MGNVATESFAQLAKRGVRRKLSQRPGQGLNGWFAKKQRTKGLEKGSGIRHKQCVYIRTVDTFNTIKKIQQSLKNKTLTPREIRRLQTRYTLLASKLSSFDSLSQGSVMPNPPSAWRWTRKVRGKTVSLGLSPAKAQKMIRAIGNQRAMDAIIDELRDISQKLILLTPETFNFAQPPYPPKTTLT